MSRNCEDCEVAEVTMASMRADHAAALAEKDTEIERLKTQCAACEHNEQGQTIAEKTRRIAELEREGLNNGQVMKSQREQLLETRQLLANEKARATGCANAGDCDGADARIPNADAIISALRAELAANAAMLAKQTDLARQAEIDASAARDAQRAIEGLEGLGPRFELHKSGRWIVIEWDNCTLDGLRQGPMRPINVYYGDTPPQSTPRWTRWEASHE